MLPRLTVLAILASMAVAQPVARTPGLARRGGDHGGDHGGDNPSATWDGGSSANGGDDSSSTGDKAPSNGGDHGRGGKGDSGDGGDGSSATWDGGSSATGGDGPSGKGGDGPSSTGYGGPSSTGGGGGRGKGHGATGGDESSGAGGDGSSATGDHDASAAGGDGTSATGHNGSETGGDGSTATGGNDPSATGHNGSSETGGDGSSEIGGSGSSGTGGGGSPKTGDSGSPKTGNSGSPKTGSSGSPKTGNSGAPATGGKGLPSTKRGAGIPSESPDGGFATKLFNDKVSWYYNWRTDPLPGLEGVTFIPQIWDTFQKPGHGSMENLQQAPMLMGYNEPDGAEQANLSPADGAGAWPGLMSQCQEGGKCAGSAVVSPAMAFNNQWLVDYYGQLCPGVSPQELHSSNCEHKPKYMAMHSYKPTFEGFKSDVETFMANWPGFPIVISEFSCWNFGEGEKRCHEDINEYMKKSLDYLDGNERVAYYAAFGVGIPRGGHAGGIEQDNAIIFGDGEITELGKIYQSYGNP